MNITQTKKVIDFLFFRSAINSRNVSSLLLVGVFFLGYVAMGGKVTMIPKVETTGFGSVKTDAQQKFTLGGDVESPANSVRRETRTRDTAKAPVMAQPSSSLDRPVRKDRLSSIEARLNSLGKSSGETRSNAKERE